MFPQIYKNKSFKMPVPILIDLLRERNSLSKDMRVTLLKQIDHKLKNEDFKKEPELLKEVLKFNMENNRMKSSLSLLTSLQLWGRKDPVLLERVESVMKMLS